MWNDFDGSSGGSREKSSLDIDLAPSNEEMNVKYLNTYQIGPIAEYLDPPLDGNYFGGHCHGFYKEATRSFRLMCSGSKTNYVF